MRNLEKNNVIISFFTNKQHFKSKLPHFFANFFGKNTSKIMALTADKEPNLRLRVTMGSLARFENKNIFFAVHSLL
jgi:uncharacterized protein (DUF608 family)